MSQSFVTVTKTVFTTSTAAPLNSTQLHNIEVADHIANIVGIASAGAFGLMILIIGTCSFLLWLRKKPTSVATENPDAVRQGRDAFLPLIGKKRQSTMSLVKQEMGGGSTAALIPGGGPRRMSMWAEEPITAPSHPEPSIPQQGGSHSRSLSSNSSVDDTETPSDLGSSSRASTWMQQQNYPLATQRQTRGPIEFTSLIDGSAPRTGHVNHTPDVAFAPDVTTGRYSFEEGGREEAMITPVSLEESVGMRGLGRYEWEIRPGTAR